MQVGERDALPVALELHALVEVAEVALDHLLAADDAVPHHVARPTATLLRVFLALRVEVQGYLRVEPDAEVVVHDAVLDVVLATGGIIIWCQKWGLIAW